MDGWMDRGREVWMERGRVSRKRIVLMILYFKSVHRL